MGEVEFDGEGSFLKFVIAGGIAGTAEHCGMFPLDTIKTHVQAVRPNGQFIGLTESVRVIKASSRGARGFFRGITPVIALAAPAHAVYFSAYEVAKKRLGVVEHGDDHQPLETALAGTMATTLSDLMMVPMETVKQRMQLNLKPYRGVLDCVRQVARAEGASAFWAGYTTTLTMNLPYAGVWFASYESLRKLLHTDEQKENKDYVPLAHIAAGGGAGAVASAFTNPFDVAKTRLQTQGDVGKRYGGMFDAMRTIWQEEGLRGYARGVRPRMVFHAFSGAICWGTYELCKNYIGS